jgi:hypothetical protein
MGLTGALVDRARTVESRRSGRRVEGRTVFRPVAGTWFKARLELPQGSETDAPTGARTVIVQPTLMFATRDSDGQPVEVTNQKRVEVDSAQLGRTVWDVIADPQPIRKRRTVIGWQAPLRRVEMHEAEEAP